MFYPIFFRPAGRSVNKEDAFNVLKALRVYYSIISLLMTFILFFTHFIVSPKIDEIYKTFSIQRPIFSFYLSYLSLFLAAILLLTSVYVIFSSKITENVENRLRRYKPGEMININDVFGWLIKGEVIVILLLGLVVGLAAYSNIYPMYQLTASF